MTTIYLDGTEKFILGSSYDDVARVESDHHVYLAGDATSYRHKARFTTRAHAERMLTLIKDAGQICLDCWDADHHGVFDTNVDYEGNVPCERCAGTGQFTTYVENGKAKGPGGAICYRCEGKGHHNQADRKRNSGHDAHYMARL